MGNGIDGRVAFITGAARGQGRSHAVRFAEEGADIIAVDSCAQIDSVTYPMSEPADLQETIDLVTKTGRRIIAEQADVRDFEGLKAALARGVAEFGRLDFVLANAGMMPIFGQPSPQISAYLDAIDVMLNGVYRTIEAALPALLEHGDGGAIVITSSSAGLNANGAHFSTMGPGQAGYVAAKHGVVGLMRYYASSLAGEKIRVNSVHPTEVMTPMAVDGRFEQHAQQDAQSGDTSHSRLATVPLIEARDVTDVMVYLCGTSGRYITGTTRPVTRGRSLATTMNQPAPNP